MQTLYSSRSAVFYVLLWLTTCSYYRYKGYSVTVWLQMQKQLREKSIERSIPENNFTALNIPGQNVENEVKKVVVCDKVRENKNKADSNCSRQERFILFINE